jgi:hypothetical protein
MVANEAPEDDMSAVQLAGGAAGSTSHFPPLLSALQPASTVHSGKGTTAQGMVMAVFASASGGSGVDVRVDACSCAPS